MDKKPIISTSEINPSSTVLEKLGNLAQLAIENGQKIKAQKILYESLDHSVVGFVVYPSNIGEKEKLPCIIWNRGGSLEFGGIKIGQLFVDLAELALAGYFVIASQYSGWGESGGKDEFGGADLNDLIVLKDVLEKYPQADTNNIGMYGWSRGGMMAYQILAQVDWVKAAVVGGAPANEVRAPEYREGWAEHQVKMYGGTKEEQIKRSAVYWAEKFPKDVPLLMMHGTADWRVNPQDSLDLSSLLLLAKVPHRLIMFEGADHGITQYKKEVSLQTLNWFDRFLKKNELIPDLNPHGE